jgi:hypothetical protein
MQSLKNSKMATWNLARDVSFRAVEENLFCVASSLPWRLEQHDARGTVALQGMLSDGRTIRRGDNGAYGDSR